MKKKCNYETLKFVSANKNIKRIAAQMSIAKAHVDAAFNYFKMALDLNMTRGRKSEHVLAACLYLVCRSIPTSHILLLSHKDVSNTDGKNGQFLHESEDRTK